MALPVFSSTNDPGSAFTDLLRCLNQDPKVSRFSNEFFSYRSANESTSQFSTNELTFRHATTVMAIKFSQGVLIAGDRRATEGYSIAYRNMEKVFPGDRYSAIAIAGTAGPALELVKLFQTQLEHYEKVEGTVLSLEGKANQLSQLVRANLSSAFQGMVVIPLFAGWDCKRKVGRIFTYDVTGGRYEEADYHATGSGGRHARTTIKLGYKEGMSLKGALRLGIQALYEAADEDLGTGGPDALRGIYPTVATVTEKGFEFLEEAEVAGQFETFMVSKSSSGDKS
ncbi:MAG: proteasome subunit beta [Actinobacteria bacterium]|nr:proteasome subunit beta [Actinomycetota bacterium]MCL6105711.1 proteasome subunit beta [Actinomycetota bacterium]